MQIDTKDLIKDFEKVPEKFRDHFTQVPDQLITDAVEELNGESSTKVTRNSDSGRRLIAWAKNEKNKRKRKRKAQSNARKKGRH